MEMQKIRIWIIFFALLSLIIVISFFLIAPLIGFPANWGESIGLAQIVIPVFAGHLGSAAAFSVSEKKRPEINFPRDRLIVLILLFFGSLLVLFLTIVLAVLVFWLSNRPGEFFSDNGMKIDDLRNWLVAGLSIFSIASNHIIIRTFRI